MGQQQFSGQFPLVNALVAAQDCGLGADDASVGTVPWSTPNNIAIAGQAASVLCPAGGVTHYLDVTNFGFAIPADATIDGVTVTFVKSAGAQLIDASVRLLKAGVPSGVDHASPAPWPQASPGPAAYGSSIDPWGLVLTPTDVNAANFGVALAAHNFASSTIFAAVWAFVQMQIFYTRASGGQGIALADAAVVGSPAQWTMGATTVLPIPFQPGLTTPWSIDAWSLSYQGQHAQPIGPLTSSFGRLGELWCGLLFNTGGSTQGGSVPWVTPVRPLPSDLSTFAKVWDGSVDPPFPWQSALAPPKYNGFTSQLPIPQKMQSGEQIAIGLWLQPALVQNVQTQILNATYSITYDDGIE